MDNWIAISVVFAVGVLLLLADFFLPSHGILTVASLAVLGYGLYRTFLVSQEAGLAALAALLVGVPTVLYIAVKNWHRTRVGRLISPPNPVLTPEDRLPVAEMERMIGRVGRTLTPLRPVGTCVFDDRRVECVSEQGVIAAAVEVEAIRLADRTLVVRPAAGPNRNVT
ncbi:MAG: hypothetical protein HRF43_17945 [Phycisphaerae bacterium]|jgi:membrane-bound serine protease (ClpP class)